MPRSTGNVFPQHDYMVGYGGWAPDYADPYTYLELFMSDNVYNYSITATQHLMI